MSIAAPIIRSPDEADRPAILSVLTAAFGRDDEARLVEKLWAAKAMVLEFAAEQGNAITGYCAFSNVTADPAIGGLLLGLAPVAVAPGSQNSGIGKVLVEHGIHGCRSNDAALIVVLGAPKYYERFGFEPASSFNMRWAVQDAGDAFQLIDCAGVASSVAHKIDYHPAFSEV